MTESKLSTGAEILLKALNDQGVDVIFGYPGGIILPIYDELFKQDKIRHILVRHEQGALHAAEGYARSTGKVGCVLVTSGPGATNTVTGLADALMDSVPLVCLTGQVPTQMIGNDAFQEADTTGITRPCTKHNYLVKTTDALSRTIAEAFHVARTGRPGPVVVDLPKDVLTGRAEYHPLSQFNFKYRPTLKGNLGTIETAVKMIAEAKRPIFYIGGGVINSGVNACQLLTQFVRMTGFPCTHTLMALGAFPGTDPLSLGMLGMHGNYEANMAMHDCDVMICVGARFDDRVTGHLPGFSPNSKKIHIDIDPSSINKNVMVDIPIVGDVAHVLEDALKIWRAKGYSPNTQALKQWWEEITEWRSINCLAFNQPSKGLIKPQYVIQRLYELTKAQKPYITTEVGQHQIWAAQLLRFDDPMHWMTSGGLGTMGYGLPSAIGVQIAHPDALVVDVSGEASFQMNMQELGTIMQYKLPVKILILNNQFMGMVRQWQELIHGGRYSESQMNINPDFIKLAEAYGFVGLSTSDPSEVDNILTQMITTPGPIIVDIHTNTSENCFPMIMPGMAHNEMLLGMDTAYTETDDANESSGLLA